MDVLLKGITDMKNIKELVDKEKGSALMIIGGGPSVKALTEICQSFFHQSKLKRNLKFMTINFYHELSITPEYNIYQDGTYKEYIEKGKLCISNKTTVISLKEQACYRTNYYFIQNDMILPGTHTGFVALQIADKILNPDKIFLIGFDYYKDNGKIHYYSDGLTKIQKIRYASAFKGMLRDFKKCSWNKERIINLNPKSLLKL